MSQPIVAPSSAPPTSAGGLVCGHCRRKTGEAVSKLCHACGTPLHASCSSGVAIGIGVGVGVGASTAFCSKRCHDSELLAHSSREHQQQQQQHAQQQKQLPPVPNEITAALTVRVGDVGKTSRKYLALTSFRFLLTEGFEVFKAKANNRTSKELQQHAAHESYVRDDRAIYIKPGVHSKQAELVELTEKNFEARIARSFHNFLKRKPAGESNSSNGNGNSNGSNNGNGSDTHFECEILTYVHKDSGRRRSAGGKLHHSASAVKSTSQMHTLMEYADHHSASPASVDPGSSAGASSAASAVAGDPSSSGHNKRRHSQTLFSDLTASSSASLRSPQSDMDPAQDPGYKTIRMVLNGQVVPVKVNVRDLLACFGMTHSSATGTAGDHHSDNNHNGAQDDL